MLLRIGELPRFVALAIVGVLEASFIGAVESTVLRRISIAFDVVLVLWIA